VTDKENLERALDPVVKATARAAGNSPELSAFLVDALDIETQLGPACGGDAGKEVRTILGFCMGRLVSLGADLDALDQYIAGTIAQLRALRQL
jgi:hypothetical protein